MFFPLCVNGLENASYILPLHVFCYFVDFPLYFCCSLTPKMSSGGGEVRRVFCPYARQADPAGPCKARNNLCKLEREGFIESSPAQDCDLCCKMPDFCRECCCVFCHRVVDYSFGGYSYIKCEAVLEENKICGHIGHLDCALRTFMAGTVGGCIDLDMQYCCRRCDNKTNLMLHVEKFLEICQSLQSRDDIEPILNTGLCLVRGSRQTRAKSLESIMRSAMAKVWSVLFFLATCGNFHFGHHLSSF